jgi:hypothetical protein
MRGYPLLDPRPDALERFALHLDQASAKAGATLDEALVAWWHTYVAPTVGYVRDQTGSQDAAREVAERAVARVHAAAAELGRGVTDSLEAEE